MNSFNWQWWQYFLALAEHGSLSKAAQVLSVSQPTLSRQLVAMEEKLGQALFDRSTQGLTLTQFGAGFLEQAQEMEANAQRLQRYALGQENRLTGKLRISVNEMVAQFYLPKILPLFMDLYSEVSVEIIVSNHASSLDKRDADIAIRMFPPTQLDIKARHLFDIPLGFFAHPDYLDAVGRPTSHEDLFNCRVLGFDRDQLFIKGARSIGWDIKREDFLFRSDFMPMHLEIARNKGGVVATHKALCLNVGLEELSLGFELPSLPIYLACHRDVQNNLKIRVMMDFLAEHLESLTKVR